MRISTSYPSLQAPHRTALQQRFASNFDVINYEIQVTGKPTKEDIKALVGFRNQAVTDALTEFLGPDNDHHHNRMPRLAINRGEKHYVVLRSTVENRRGPIDTTLTEIIDNTLDGKTVTLPSGAKVTVKKWVPLHQRSARGRQESLRQRRAEASTARENELKARQAREREETGQYMAGNGIIVKTNGYRIK